MADLRERMARLEGLFEGFTRRPGTRHGSTATFDAFSAARALEAAGVGPRRAEATASAIAVQTVTRADLEPFATKAGLRTLQRVVGIQSAIALATFAIVAARLL